MPLTTKFTASQRVWAYGEGYDTPKMYIYRCHTYDGGYTGKCTLDGVAHTGWVSIHEDYLYSSLKEACAAQVRWVKGQIEKHKNVIWREQGYLKVAQNCLEQIESEMV